MLNTDEVIAIEIEKLCGSLIGSLIFLVKFNADLAGIVVCRIRIIHRDGKQSMAPKFRSKSGA